ncbi:hypothetical protein VTI28DRAFT_2032 [Corynascus sepedonium]
MTRDATRATKAANCGAAPGAGRTPPTTFRGWINVPRRDPPGGLRRGELDLEPAVRKLEIRVSWNGVRTGHQRVNRGRDTKRGSFLLFIPQRPVKWARG